MKIETPRGKLRVYGMGGCGINITQFFLNAEEEPNCALIKTGFVDTSRSNFKGDYNDEDVFVLPDTDGSGKIRATNYEDITNVTKQILHQIPPLDFNIVVFSLSGGSGSVSAALVISELLERDIPVVAIGVGSSESKIEAENSIKSLKTLDSIAKKHDKPVVMYYEHNSRGRQDVDISVRVAISSLAVLTSRRNREMDSQDIYHWLNFNKTTTIKPQLAQLEIINSSEDGKHIKDPISVASIYSSEEITPAELNPDYHTAGYLDEAKEKFEQLHFVISVDAIPSIYKKDKEILEKFNERTVSRAKQISVFDEHDKPTDEGVLL